MYRESKNHRDPNIILFYRFTTMEWTTEMTLEFIELYEKNPVLWDPKHIHHKNRNHLYDAWMSIKADFTEDVQLDTLKRKKESLMSTYRILSRKVRNSQTTGSGATDIYKPSWFAYQALDRFIRATGKKQFSLDSEVNLLEFVL